MSTFKEEDLSYNTAKNVTQFVSKKKKGPTSAYSPSKYLEADND